MYDRSVGSGRSTKRREGEGVVGLRGEGERSDTDFAPIQKNVRLIDIGVEGDDVLSVGKNGRTAVQDKTSNQAEQDEKRRLRGKPLEHFCLLLGKFLDQLYLISTGNSSSCVYAVAGSFGALNFLPAM